MPDLACQHGSLARKCELCERDADIKELRALLGEARTELLNAANSAVLTLSTKPPSLPPTDAIDRYRALAARISTALVSAEPLPEDAPRRRVKWLPLSDRARAALKPPHPVELLGGEMPDPLPEDPGPDTLPTRTRPGCNRSGAVIGCRIVVCYRKTIGCTERHPHPEDPS